MSANKCGNCNSLLSCGCQRRAASDGKACCNQCIGGYEAELKQKKAAANRPKNTDVGAPIINNVKYNP